MAVYSIRGSELGKMWPGPAAHNIWLQYQQHGRTDQADAWGIDSLTLAILGQFTSDRWAVTNILMRWDQCCHTVILSWPPSRLELKFRLGVFQGNIHSPRSGYLIFQPIYCWPGLMYHCCIRSHNHWQMSWKLEEGTHKMQIVWG